MITIEDSKTQISRTDPCSANGWSQISPMNIQCRSCLLQWWGKLEFDSVDFDSDLCVSLLKFVICPCGPNCWTITPTCSLHRARQKNHALTRQKRSIQENRNTIPFAPKPSTFWRRSPCAALLLKEKHYSPWRLFEVARTNEPVKSAYTIDGDHFQFFVTKSHGLCVPWSRETREYLQPRHFYSRNDKKFKLASCRLNMAMAHDT